MLPRNDKNQKNSVPKETKFCCFKFTSYTVFIFRQAKISIILSCKLWIYCMYDFLLVIIYCRYGCGNNVHVKCMKVWAEHQRSTGENIIKCPLCRVDFGSFQVCKPGKGIIFSIKIMICNWMISLHHTVGRMQNMDLQPMNHSCGPTPWTPSWTKSMVYPCGPPLIFEDEWFY